MVLILQIYDCELEKVKVFENCFRLLETYPLYKGKQSTNNPDSIQCYFKGNFLLYSQEEELRKNFERTVIKRYGGFLRLLPSNTPVQVKARIYIIKATLTSVRDSGVCDPYLSIEIGDKIIEDVTNVRNNTTDPLFGCSYELDIKFPYDFQLVISVKDFVNKRLIGKTKIDLENRLYSNCYASCGLPKKYETSGYNAWRDFLIPTQILERLCKKWRLAKPIYDLRRSTLKVVTIDDQTKIYRIKTMTMSESEEYRENGKDDEDSDDYDDEDKTSTIEESKLNIVASVSLNNNSSKDVELINEKLALMALNDWENISGVIVNFKTNFSKNHENLTRQGLKGSEKEPSRME